MRAKRPDVVASCRCGARFKARTLDGVNAALVKHYKACDGSAPVRKAGRAASK